MIKVGIVGCGTMGKTHAAAYANIPEVDVVAVADVRSEAVREVASQYGTVAYQSPERLIAEPGVDVIDVCVPTPLHKRYAVQAASAKKHVFCEKPLARTLNDAADIIDAARAHKVILGVGHVVRFFPDYISARRDIESGMIGEPAVARLTRGGAPFPLGWQDWYANFDWSGGVILDLMIHDLDWLRWTFGEVNRVFAKTTRGRDANRAEYALVVLRFESGVIAHVAGEWIDRGGFRSTFEVAGSEGLLTVHPRAGAPLSVKKTGVQEGQVGVTVPESPLAKSPYQLELEHFVDCVEKRQEPMINGDEAYRALEIALAAIESAQTGNVVHLAKGESL